MTDEEIADLSTAVKTFGATVAELKLRRIRMMRLLVVSVVFDICLSVCLGVVAIRANQTANTARAASSLSTQLKVSERTRCESGNEFRAADRARWNYLISIGRKPTTAAARRSLTKFESYIDAADKPKVCK